MLDVVLVGLDIGVAGALVSRLQPLAGREGTPSALGLVADHHQVSVGIAHVLIHQLLQPLVHVIEGDIRHNLVHQLVFVLYRHDGLAVQEVGAIGHCKGIVVDLAAVIVTLLQLAHEFLLSTHIFGGGEAVTLGA